MELGGGAGGLASSFPMVPLPHIHTEGQKRNMRALIIRSPYVEAILDGKKTWEIRGSRTSVRGPVGLIRSRSGKVFGMCDVVDCVGPLTSEQFRKNARKAGMKPSEAVLGYYNKTYAWFSRIHEG